MSVSTPILIAGSRNCCALAASGHAAADPTSPETKSRRRMPIPQQTIRQILAFNSGHQNRKLRPAKWVMVHFAVRKSMAVSSGLCQLPPAADMRTVWAWGSCLWPGDKLTGDFGSEPDAHLPAIVACFVVWREICHPAFSAFCNKICHKPTSNYPPAEPGALGCEPLEAADGVADAAPVNGGHLKVASQRHRFICSRRLSSSSCFLM